MFRGSGQQVNYNTKDNKCKGFLQIFTLILCVILLHLLIQN
nr:MAG TPA: hypothetical protein [Caudoviricetes sp.]